MSVIENFKKIAAIPRESGNEEGVRRFLCAWAAENKIACKTDSVGNVVMYAPATPGYENVAPVALQGHMDMVCVKKPGSDHDFLRDPIEVVIDGDIMSAKDTSLGADDGIAVAMEMDILTDKECKHGPVECIFTVTEETGLVGAFGLDPSLVSARKMVNLDSEEEGVIYIGCAGGMDCEGVFEKPKKAVSDSEAVFSLSVSGLKSGHSGGEIHLQRANAIKVAARLMFLLSKSCSFKLVSFDGGTKHNAIPAEASVVFAVRSCDASLVSSVLEPAISALLHENAVEEPQMQISVTQCCSSSLSCFGKADSEAFINSLFMAPHGVLAMSKTLPGIVQTSCNLAIVKTEGEKIFIRTSQRSNVPSQIRAASDRMAMILSTSGAVVEVGNGYPAWDPDPNSELAAFCSKAWEDMFGKKPVLTAIHAGLECGIINSRIPGMDSVSIGPDLQDVHTVNEKVSISSVERLTSYVKYLLSIIR